MLTSVPRPKKATPEVHGAKKKQFQFMLTPDASEQLDCIADAAGITRSECMERLIRCADAKVVKNYGQEEDK
jgi:DNA-binding Lrp family transcriptional regulator